MARHGVAALLLATLVMWSHMRLGAAPIVSAPCDKPPILLREVHETLHCGVGPLASTLLRCPPERPVHPGDVLVPEETPEGCRSRVHPLPAHRRLALGLPLDANHASQGDLTALPGIGPALAARIQAARPFTAVDDLLRVRGIGSVRLETLAPRLTVAPPRPLWPSWPPPAASTLQKP